MSARSELNLYRIFLLGLWVIVGVEAYFDGFSEAGWRLCAMILAMMTGYQYRRYIEASEREASADAPHA